MALPVQNPWSALIIAEGRILRLAFESEESSKGWMTAFEHMHQSRYTPQDITDKEDLVKVYRSQPLLDLTENF
jgi:hypothetical protein